LAGAPRGAAHWLELIDGYRRLALEPPKFVDHLIADLKLEDWFGTEGDADADSDSSSANLGAVRDLCSRFVTLPEMLDTIDKMETHRRLNSRKRDVVLISTVHRAKGREWPVVYICQVGTTLFPTSKGDPAEERRVFYVACTRAMDELWISGPAYSVDGDPVGESWLAVEIDLKTVGEFEARRVIQDPEPVGTQIGFDLERI
jgi:superfamily I DNA/RNA helicase